LTQPLHRYLVGVLNSDALPASTSVGEALSNVCTSCDSMVAKSDVLDSMIAAVTPSLEHVWGPQASRMCQHQLQL